MSRMDGKKTHTHTILDIFFRQRDRYDDDYLDEEDSEKDLWKHCAMLPVKDDVASIFARSPRGEKEFPDFAINQRAAVAVGRYLQDPLVEFAGGWVGE